MREGAWGGRGMAGGAAKGRQKFFSIFFFNFFCENRKLDYHRFLGDIFYHGTLNLPCIRESTSIRNWVTFCGLNTTKHQGAYVVRKRWCIDSTEGYPVANTRRLTNARKNECSSLIKLP